MKGVIVSAGLGTRMRPLTNIVSKNLLPVYNKPLIYYSIEILKEAGISDIILIVNKRDIKQYKTIVGNGDGFDVKIIYAIQHEQKGTAHAILCAEEFAGGENIAVIFADNILEDKIDAGNFKGGARIFLKQVPDPERFGIAEIKDGRIISLEEKPKEPKSNYAVIGIYIYDSRVFDYIRTLKPSGRGELEITDLNNIYFQNNDLDFSMIKGFWIDAGTFDSMLEAGNLMKERFLKK